MRPHKGRRTVDVVTKRFDALFAHERPPLVRSEAKKFRFHVD